jgi:hypothetical protein
MLFSQLRYGPYDGRNYTAGGPAAMTLFAPFRGACCILEGIVSEKHQS